MPFKAAVDAHLDSLDPESFDFKILSFLRRNAIGASKAKSWIKIQETLSFTEKDYSKSKFQNGLLGSSRANPFFICSSQKGYYIADNVSDVTIAKHYYESRIKSMLLNLNNLVNMSNRIYPNCDYLSVELWLDATKKDLNGLQL